MNWDILDFAVFGAMLAGVGIVYILIRRQSASATYRWAFGVALAGAFFLVWVNGAVGIIGDEGNDANMMYFGVLAVGVVGAVIARLKPQGMERTLYATALAQVVVAAIALFAGLGSTAPIWPAERKPRNFQVFPASSDRYTPRPVITLLRIPSDPVPTYTICG